MFPQRVALLKFLRFRTNDRCSSLQIDLVLLYQNRRGPAAAVFAVYIMRANPRKEFCFPYFATPDTVPHIWDERRAVSASSRFVSFGVGLKAN